MISRIHGAHSTLAANPRRKKHKAHKRANPRRRRRRNPEEAASSASSSSHKKSRKKSRKLFAFRSVKRTNKKTGKTYRSYRLSRNPGVVTDDYGNLVKVSSGSSSGKKRKTYKRKPTKYGVYSRGKGKFSVRKIKNPSLMIAGVPVIEMAIGSVAAIGVGAVAAILVDKYAKQYVPTAIQDITGELATAAVAAFAHSKLSNSMHKSIAQFAFIGAVFQIINKKTYKPLYNAVASPLGAQPLAGHGHTHGVYFDAYTAQGAVGGAYLPAMSGASEAMGGMYASVDGMGLFHAPSIYG